MTVDLNGKVMFITGAGRGIGSGIAESATTAGAHVALNALTPTHVTTLATRLDAESQGRAVAIVGDVSTPQGAQEVFAKVLAEFGQVDILVNNLGDAIAKPLVALPGDDREPMNDEEVATVVRINLAAAIHCARAVGPHLLERRRGKVVNISSFAASTGGNGTVVYTAAKTAVSGLTRALALEWAPYNIQVNAVAPGSFPNPVTNGANYPLYRARAAERTPAGRAGELQEVGHAVCYLASEQADYVTGHTLAVDGGLTLV
jgi:NAD(P)-dependent dehydrogenase (short-subunit alcohol dehydrogenase family)